ncbi:hypothetical protein [Deinococcus sp.]|uniref:hypothetical protein n=1 Tax=Deinococcus sp. TaxID=47478 RepID=UPI003C7BD5DF
MASFITESLWPARLAVLTIIALQVLLNERLTAGPNWLLPGLEAALVLIAFLNLANLASPCCWLRRCCTAARPPDGCCW